MVVRLQQSKGNHAADAGVRLRAQALVKDILMSRLEVDAEIGAQEYVHAQGFADPGKALAASRALQAAFEGFRTAVPSARTNISMLLDSSAAEEAGQASPSVEQKDLLDSARPSQVLITQAFYDRIAHYQPALRSSPLRAGVYEFLWTSEQRLNQLQAELELVPVLVEEPAPPAVEDETVIIRRPAVPETEMRRSEPKRRSEPVRRPAPEPEPVLDDQEGAGWLSSHRLLVIGSAIVMLLAVVGYLVSSHILMGNRTAPPVQSAPPTGPPALPMPAPVPNQPVRPATTPNPPTPPVSHNPPPVTTAADDNGQATKRGCTIPGQIPDYLRLAEGKKSRGDYDGAITNYMQVLGCEPGNQQAKLGLKSAKAARDLH